MLYREVDEERIQYPGPEVLTRHPQHDAGKNPFFSGTAHADGTPAVIPHRWDGVTSIVYRGMDDHIHELYLPLPAQSPSTTWTHGDLTSLTAAPLADGDPVGWAFMKKEPLAA